MRPAQFDWREYFRQSCHHRAIYIIWNIQKHLMSFSYLQWQNAMQLTTTQLQLKLQKPRLKQSRKGQDIREHWLNLNQELPASVFVLRVYPWLLFADVKRFQDQQVFFTPGWCLEDIHIFLFDGCSSRQHSTPCSVDMWYDRQDRSWAFSQLVVLMKEASSSVSSGSWSQYMVLYTCGGNGQNPRYIYPDTGCEA